MQQVALAAIDAYVTQPDLRRRRSAVPVTELREIFADLPSVDAAKFRADQDRYVDDEAHFDAYRRAQSSEDSE
ncbi:hypothetical protein ACIBCN_09700 [Nocardia sp. NPDC051052]|uniref:hypothetical protein n=1 Tax=Nocardia sp. NPDC051052 TaxID=3364322 RepID=UPI0037A2B458